MINTQQAIAAYEASGELGAELHATIASPGGRRQIYELLQGKALDPFHALIRAMFEQEMRYRKAPSECEADAEDEDAISGIYRCAFLLYQIGDPEDVFMLWAAKLLNMDVYCMLGAQYFVGAGINETLAFLEDSGRVESGKILEYLKSSFDAPHALDEQRQWEEARRADPDNVWL